MAGRPFGRLYSFTLADGVYPLRLSGDVGEAMKIFELSDPEARMVEKVRAAKRERRHTIFVVSVTDKGIVITMEAVPDWKIVTKGGRGG